MTCTYCRATIKAYPNRRLTILQEQSIADLRAAGWTLQALANLYQLSRSGVLRILRRRK